MVLKPDFATLDLRDALDLAMLIEEEARERYEEFALQMEVHHTGEAAGFFRAMAGYEKAHGDALALRRQVLFPDAPRRVGRSMVWEEEAPGYEAVRAFMTPREAMQVALGAERKAQRFFEEALPHVLDPEVKTLFTELHEEEIHHEALVEAQIAKLPPDPAATPEDFADEPVAQ